MTHMTQRRSDRGTTALVAVILTGLLVCAVGGLPAQAEQLRTDEQTYPITIDATAIVSQSWWHVPGVTPSIWTSDPETSDAYRTTETRVLHLKPGPYKFISFTFDFPFEVSQKGTVAYPPALDECVGGRGTSVLIVRCKRTYPHGGKPDYSLTP